MTSHDLKQVIDYWTEWASKDGVQQYDIALMKIWIQLERFLSELFIKYAIGVPSETGFLPRLKIKFLNEEHLNIFIRNENKKYIEYLDKIEKLSKHIFLNNPFDIIFSDANIAPAFSQIKIIRNYIAHESDEAKRKMINGCFNGDGNKFLEPNEYLKSKEKGTRNTYYTYYINIIISIIDIVISDI